MPNSWKVESGAFHFSAKVVRSLMLVAWSLLSILLKNAKVRLSNLDRYARLMETVTTWCSTMMVGL